MPFPTTTLPLLLACCYVAGVATQSSFDTSTFPDSLRCFDDAVTPSASAETVRLQYHNWESHNVGRWVLAIILRELLGYKVEFIDSNAYATVELFARIADNELDIDHETWAATKQSVYDRFVTELNQVEDVGELGTTGIERLWLPSSVASAGSETAPPEYFRTYLSEPTAPLPVLNSSHTSTVGADLECADGSGTFGNCSGGVSNLPGRYACMPEAFPEWECQEGIWYSDACCNASSTTCADNVTALERCMEVWFPAPVWSTGIFEQSLQNLDVPASFAYMGDTANYQSRVEAQLSQTVPPVFYWFQPDPWLSRLDTIKPVEPLVLPPWSNECYETVLSTPEGSIACSTQLVNLKKIVRAGFASRAPNAHHLIQRFKLTSPDFSFMFDLLNLGENHFNASCEFVKKLRTEQPAQFSAMVVPSVDDIISISNPTSVVFVCLAAVIIVVICVLVVVFVRFRESKTVGRHSGSGFLIMQLLGIATMSLAAIVTVSETSVVACALREWLLALGFAVANGTLFAKHYRIFRIMDAAKSLKRTAITNKDLLPVIGGIVSLTIVLLIAVETTRGDELEREIVDGDFVNVVVICPNTSIVARSALLGGLALLMLWGLYVAVGTISVKAKFNTSRSTGMAVYTYSLCATITVVFHLLLNNPNTLVFLMVGAEVFASAANVVIVFSPILAQLRSELRRGNEEPVKNELQPVSARTFYPSASNRRSHSNRDSSTSHSVQPSPKSQQAEAAMVVKFTGTETVTLPESDVESLKAESRPDTAEEV